MMLFLLLSGIAFEGRRHVTPQQVVPQCSKLDQLSPPPSRLARTRDEPLPALRALHSLKINADHLRGRDRISAPRTRRIERGVHSVAVNFLLTGHYSTSCAQAGRDRAAMNPERALAPSSRLTIVDAQDSRGAAHCTFASCRNRLSQKPRPTVSTRMNNRIVMPKKPYFSQSQRLQSEIERPYSPLRA